MVYEDNLLKFRIEYNNQFIGEEELDEIILSLKHLLGNIADCNNKKIAEVGIISESQLQEISDFRRARSLKEMKKTFFLFGKKLCRTKS